MPEFDKTLDLPGHGEMTPEPVDGIIDSAGILCDVATNRNLIEPIETGWEFIDADRFGLYFTALVCRLSVEPNPIMTGP